MIKSELLAECGRRLGDTSAGFLAILSHAFDFVLLELAQLDCLSALRRTSPFPLTEGVVSRGLLECSTQAITGLAAPLYPSALRRLFVPEWGAAGGQLERTSDGAFETEWMNHGVAYTGRPRRWRAYPNIQQLQLWPAPDDGSRGATALLEFDAPPTQLGDLDPIEELALVDLPTLLAGLYRHGVKFQDETIKDMGVAENMWAVGIGVLKTRLAKAQYTGRMVQIGYRDV